MNCTFMAAVITQEMEAQQAEAETGGDGFHDPESWSRRRRSGGQVIRVMGDFDSRIRERESLSHNLMLKNVK